MTAPTRELLTEGAVNSARLIVCRLLFREPSKGVANIRVKREQLRIGFMSFNVCKAALLNPTGLGSYARGCTWQRSWYFKFRCL